MAAPTRKITVYNTVGLNKQAFESAATTWGDLQKELHSKGIETKNMKVVVGETQNSLEAPNASLLAESFSLLMMPQKVKSGSKELVIK